MIFMDFWMIWNGFRMVLGWLLVDFQLDRHYEAARKHGWGHARMSRGGELADLRQAHQALQILQIDLEHALNRDTVRYC